jgi:serine/threonine-protein kinase HipA
VRATGVERALVLSGDDEAGALERTPRGSRFVYAPAFLARCNARGWGLGFTVPRQPEVVTEGANLHPFLAGLLPEGTRLEALTRATKTSPDDLLSLLLAAGPETVGDVRVVPGAREATAAPPVVVDLARLSALSFEDLLAGSLDYQHPTEHRSIPGVQPKVSAAVLTAPVRVRGAPREECILKLAPAALPRLVENELFFMGMARACGLPTADVELVRDARGVSALLVTRFDRLGPLRLHAEDGCQLLDRYPADKYRVTFRDVAQAVLRFSSAPALDAQAMLRLLAFSYLIGNGDLHARNVSLLVQPDGRVGLSPAYDLLTTLPYGDRRLALKVAGRDDNLRRTHLLELARQLGLGQRLVTQTLEHLCEAAAPFLSRLSEPGFGARQVADLGRVMRKRRDELGRA